MTRRGFRGFPAGGALLLCVLLILPAQARGGGDNPELQEMVDELRALSEKSRQQRAADRWLQQALEDLVSKYDWPWRKELLNEDFSDGNYTEQPAWQVVSGRFWVDPSLGLRSRVKPEEPPPSQEASRDRSSGSSQEQDIGSALIGALLNQTLKQESSGRDEPEPRKETPREGPAAIRLATEITNAFSLEMAFSVHNEPGAEGHFEVALLQDPQGDFGYRLAMRTGEAGLLDLYRLRRGQRELIYGGRLKIDPGDGRVHDLVWRQSADGQIQVLMDGETAMNLRDRAFRDGYGWLELTNRGGELGVRQVRILGTP